MMLAQSRALLAALLLALPLVACTTDAPDPATTTASANASVSPDGGATVQTPDGALTVTVPQGAVDAPGKLAVLKATGANGQPGWQVDLTGARLVGDAVLRFRWMPTKPGEPLPLVTSAPTATGAATPVAGAHLEGDFVVVRTNHFSFWSIQPWGTALDQARTWMVDSLDTVLSQPGQGREPKCDSEAAARKAGYTVTSDSGRRVYWCLGKDGANVVLKVVNARGYGVSAESTPGLVLAAHQSGDVVAALADLIKSPPVVRANTVTLLESAGQATYWLDGKGKSQVGVVVRPDAGAYLLTALMFGADTFTMVAGNAAGVTKAGVQLVEALEGLSCMNSLLGLATTEINSAAAARDFFGKALEMSLSCAALAGDNLDLGPLTEVVIKPLMWVLSGLATAANGIVAAVDTILDWTGYEVRVTKPKPVAVGARCGAKDLGLNLGGASGPAADKARKLYRAVLACDKDTLVAIATADGTELSLGLTTPKEAFAIPNPDDRYSVLSRLLSVRPYVGDDGTMFWPWADPDTGEPDVSELQKAGLLRPGSDGGAKELGMYIGFRISIGANGKLGWFAEGE